MLIASHSLSHSSYAQAETSTVQPGVSESLHSPETITKLQDLMNQVFVRRSQQLPAIACVFQQLQILNSQRNCCRPSTFRVPSRVTLNDAKRQAWFADLANPAVPLNKLGKSVPHGAKGHDLLDLLQSNNVAIPRAVWFLRVFGANETVRTSCNRRCLCAHTPTGWAT